MNNKSLRKKIVNLLKKDGFYKNLPDAIKWHCAAFWGMPFKKSIKRINKTKNLLQNSIAIPIWLKKTVKSILN